MRERGTTGGPLLPEETEFDRRNAFLDFLLGLISLSERTVSTVADLAEPAAPPPRQPGRHAPPPGPLLR